MIGKDSWAAATAFIKLVTDLIYLHTLSYTPAHFAPTRLFYIKIKDHVITISAFEMQVFTNLFQVLLLFSGISNAF